jgi:hypothetical protein
MQSSLPSRDLASLHNVVNDLRINMDGIARNPEVTGNIRASHGYYHIPELQTWSESCARKSREDNGFACGFRKILHVMSVAVVEQHIPAMGDLNRVLVPHVLTTVRDYGFGNNDEARNHILSSYRECQESEPCRVEMGI